MFDRPLYTERLSRLSGHGLVKVITGVRRCGKTTLMALAQEELIRRGTPRSAIVQIDLDRISNESLKNRRAFIEHVVAYLDSQPAGQNAASYLFVDEVQELEDWPEVINGIRAEYNVDIYVTGSNSRAFSGEKLTYLSGRYARLEMYPLSLPEWCTFRGIEPARPAEVELAHREWATWGGFPGVALSDNEDLQRAVLDGIYESVFTRDVILRGKIRNESAFLRTASYALDNIGNQTSAHAISKALAAGGHKITPDTADSYLDLMCAAHLLYRCERYDLRGKERLKTNGKYYVVDPGLRRRALGPGANIQGHLTENLVYLELLRRGYDVCVGTLPNAEIDFVAERDGRRLYVQVSETVLDPQTLARELKPFSSLDDSWPRILITKDWDDRSANGIAHVNYYDFMMGRAL